MNAPGTAAWFGDRAVMVTLTEPDQRGAVASSLARSLPTLVVRAGMQTVLVESAEPDPALLAVVADSLDAFTPVTPAARTEPRTVGIAVEYDGPDLDVVAQAFGCSTSEVISAHVGQVWSVAMMGFAPGFGYLVPNGAPLLDWGALARRDRPRARVPAGSVAVAAGMSAVYPSTMPGGWHVIGLTQARLFDASDERAPSLLLPGDLVRFTAAA